MARTYAQIQDLVEQMLQDTGATTYDTTETGYWIEESLKEFSTYIPHIVGVVFQLESRTGVDSTAVGTTSTLTDTVKDQFLTTDPTNEKVIHNTTDNTWAVVLTRTDEDVLTLSADIMRKGEKYEIYHRRCRNNKQIYLGNWGDYQWDAVDYLWIDSVEYPIGVKRNWTVYDDVLEIDVDYVADSNLNVTTLPNIDVLVRFAKPHRLLQMTDTHGALFKDEVAGAVGFPFKGFTDGETIEVGDEFHISNHRTLYTCTQAINLSSQSGAGSVCHFFPPLEAAASKDDYINFRVSTLKPQHEEIFCHLVAARAVLSDYIRHINTIPKGGDRVIGNYRQWGFDKLAEVLDKLRGLSQPKTEALYTRG